jgi:DNA polymerase-4
VFLASDHPAYDAASAQVMATLRSFPAVVEVWGWDEAFVGAETDDPEALARSMQAAVLARTGLHCSIGIGETRLLAKTATGAAKPRGVARLTRAEWIPTMGARPVTAVWGIGARTAARLADLGVRTVEDLARADHDTLAGAFGPRIGPSLRILGLGGDARPLVDEPWIAKSRSKEETFERDIHGRPALEREVARLAAAVTADVVAEHRRITHVAVKVRFATFFTRSRIMKLTAPTTDPADVVAAATTVLGRFVAGGFDLERPIRLLGVRVVLEEPTR